MERVLKSALDQLPQAVLVLEPTSWWIRFANRAAREWLRLDEQDGSSTLAERLTTTSLADLEQAAHALIGAKAELTTSVWSCCTDDGDSREMLLHVAECDAERFLLAISTEAFPQPTQCAADPACVDDLTGLPNRRALRQRFAHSPDDVDAGLESVLVPAHYAVFFVDIDDFKRVNDAFGHLVGDRALTELAHRLARCVRPDDLVARYGGDEFVLLLKLNSPEEAAAVARRIRAARSQPLELDGAATYTISVSIGIAFAAPAGSLLDELIAAADRAMYRAKSSAGGEGFAFAVSGDER